jgi:hypothetical protein
LANAVPPLLTIADAHRMTIPLFTLAVTDHELGHGHRRRPEAARTRK